MRNAPNAERPASFGPKTSPTHLRQLAAGDMDAWAYFTEVYVPLIRRFAQKLRVREIDDVVQEVTVSMYKAIHVNSSFHYDPSKGSFRGYLSRCTRNEAFAAFRKNRPQALLNEPESEIASEWDRLEREEVVYYALQELVRTGAVSPRDCEIFERRKLKLEPTDQLAEIFRVSPARVHVIVHEVRTKLAERLKAQFDWLE